MSTRTITINAFDTHIGIWQEDANDPSFRREIYGGIIRLMRRLGWTIGADPKIRQHYRILSPDHRLGKKGDLRCMIECSGRVCKVEVWAETWPIDNRNGRRYDFDKLRRMEPIDKRRFELLRRRLIAWAHTVATVEKVEYRDGDTPRFPTITARQYIDAKKSSDGRGTLTERERRTADGHILENGTLVYLTDIKGRWWRGEAHFTGGNTWQVIVGPYELVWNKLSHELQVAKPDDVRRKQNGRERRARLEREMQVAIAKMDLVRANTLRHILFGDADLFRVYSAKRGRYYAPQSRGYSSGLLEAGLYTRDEAEREVGGITELSICAVDGTPVVNREAAA